ncbi:hypothetical protein LCGC14_2245600 [marine sediment metagenome]|uniref:NADH:quinone oxidoreductase/Mrp antiporter membrane subunit domain-containing protein n=1 Tax=marine sediment metagenome TaxID=412755 RepID=A0A0F9FGP8_9ZZZZ
MLSILIFLPLVGGLAAALLPNAERRGGRDAGFVSLLFAAATLGITIGLIAEFDAGAGLQRVTDFTWISELGIHYKLGVDGLNLFLIALTALLWVVATTGSLPRETRSGSSSGRRRTSHHPHR